MNIKEIIRMIDIIEKLANQHNIIASITLLFFIVVLFGLYDIRKEVYRKIRGVDNIKLEKIKLNSEIIENLERLENRLRNSNTSVFIKRKTIKELFNKDVSNINEGVINKIIIYTDLEKAINNINKCYHNLDQNNNEFKERESLLL